MWFQQKAAPELIGKQLETHFPYNLVLPVDQLDGYAYCGNDTAKWAQHAGDPNYNLINECCQQMNREGHLSSKIDSSLGSLHQGAQIV